ncbi:MAG TPA: hypothetical protein VJY37_00435 [Anaerovoracaceae bacterium]|nr:hypothetical protein [Anaerovoracaceae bacterium]
MERVFVFFGGDTQVGTTMIAQSVAEVLGKMGKSVLLVLAGSEYGTDYINANLDMSLDDIKSNIASNQLRVEDVKGIMYEHNDVMVLPGIKNITTIKYYSTDDMAILLSPLEKAYDYIIVDAGSNIQFGLTVSALKHAGRRYYVVTQQEKCLRRFKNLYETVLNPLGYCGKLIINKFNNNMAFYTQRQVEEVLGIIDSTGHDAFGESIAVNYVEYGWQAEADRVTLLKYSRFAEGINQIAMDICGEKQVMPTKKALFKR